MQIVQFEIAGQGRRLGIHREDFVLDLTSHRPEWPRLIDAFYAADAQGIPLGRLLQQEGREVRQFFQFADLWKNADLSAGPVLRPPVDHADPHQVLVTGTGLTHTGSMQSRDQMHAKAATEDESQMSDSRKMFLMGLREGSPPSGRRGVAPEWFYKGNGSILRAHHESLDIPPFALDGGEEPELVGCYVIDAKGTPRRLGFTLSNEWSDHATEQINYLYLAPSKLRSCSFGPELILDHDFQHIELLCSVTRGAETIYDSGTLVTGERHMTHTLANLEDHHFKYPQHRVPGDIHLHFFGTSKLSHSTRKWKYQAGDIIQIQAPGFSAPLINTVQQLEGDALKPVGVEPA